MESQENGKVEETAESPQRKKRKLKRCPFCGERILEVAIRCKHCHADLVKKKHEIIAEYFLNLIKKKDVEQEGDSEKDTALAVSMLAIPILASILCWLWIGNLNLSQNPGTKLILIVALTVISTAAIGAFEAKNIGVGINEDVNKKGKRYSGPVQWFLFLCLLWIFAYPAYLYHRKRYGVRNLLIAGIFVTLISAGSFAFLGGVIQAHHGEDKPLSTILAMVGGDKIAESDLGARTELREIRLALNSYFEEYSKYPETMQELFPILDEKGESKSKIYFILDFGRAYQIAAFHEKGERAFVCSDDMPRIVSNPKELIEEQIKNRFQVIQEFGNYKIIE